MPDAPEAHGAIKLVSRHIYGNESKKKTMTAKKYVYLPNQSFVATWVKGGTLPLKISSTYYSRENKGNKTTDENLVHFGTPGFAERLGLNRDLLEQNRQLKIRGFFFHNVRFGDDAQPTTGSIHTFSWTDGLVLCCANEPSPFAAWHLGDDDEPEPRPRNYCVEIQDIEALKLDLDSQLAALGFQPGKMSRIIYNNDGFRDWRFKGPRDCWQDEFRIYWELPESWDVRARPEVNVTLKSGTAREFPMTPYSKPSEEECLRWSRWLNPRPRPIPSPFE